MSALTPSSTGLVGPLPPGVDYRLPEYRREVFLRFYAFHLRHRSHPGGVYYLIPYLRERFGWDDDEALWWAFLNGNTQNPVTTHLLHSRFPRPTDARAMLAYFAEHYPRLAFDTDRRHHKKSLPDAVRGYLALVGARPGAQAEWWSYYGSTGFDGVWAAASAIPSFGRLSTYSFMEYLRIVGHGPVCDDLMLYDRTGSRSHRNGLCKVLGRDDLDWHEASNPGFDGTYSPGLLAQLTSDAGTLLAQAQERAAGTAWEGDVGYFTLESALCTYKSWHRPNRRYPNVYNDLLHDRIRAAEAAWPDEDLSVFWDARRACLPPHLRLEDQPLDPGCVPAKQNHYRETGQPVMMHAEWPDVFANDFQTAVDSGAFGPRKARR